MEEVGVLIMLCMYTVNAVWLKYVRFMVYVLKTGQALLTYLFTP